MSLSLPYSSLVMDVAIVTIAIIPFSVQFDYCLDTFIQYDNTFPSNGVTEHSISLLVLSDLFHCLLILLNSSVAWPQRL